jgi:hypothetical protein
MRSLVFTFLALFSLQASAGAGLVIIPSSSPDLDEVTFVSIHSTHISVSTRDQTCMIGRDLLRSMGMSPVELKEAVLQGDVKTTRLFCNVLSGSQQAESFYISFKTPSR